MTFKLNTCEEDSESNFCFVFVMQVIEPDSYRKDAIWSAIAKFIINIFLVEKHNEIENELNGTTSIQWTSSEWVSLGTWI